MQSNPDDPNASVSPMVLTRSFCRIVYRAGLYDVQVYRKAVARAVGDKETKIQVTKQVYYIDGIYRCCRNEKQMMQPIRLVFFLMMREQFRSGVTT